MCSITVVPVCVESVGVLPVNCPVPVPAAIPVTVIITVVIGSLVEEIITIRIIGFYICEIIQDFFIGPKDVRQAFVDAKGEDWTRSYVDPCAWQDVPERALVPRTVSGGQKLIREGRAVLAKLNLIVLGKAA